METKDPAMQANESLKEFIPPSTAADFPAGEYQITNTDEKGRTTVYVLLSDSSIATVREGKGADVEKATMESQGTQSKYLSSMMAATVKVNGKPVNMYDIADLPMKDYMRIQVAFAEINF